MIYVTTAQMRKIEEASDKNGVSYKTLMENAGIAAAGVIGDIISFCDNSGGAVILAGSGNNGGDGFAAARRLAGAGIKTYVILTCGDPSSQLAAAQFSELDGAENAEVLYLDDNIEKAFGLMSNAPAIIDAVFGIGFRGELPPNVRACFSFASRCKAIKIALDTPSGGFCDGGRVDESALKCDYTVTFGYMKTGMLVSPLRDYCGEVITADIGFDDSFLNGIDFLVSDFDSDDIIKWLPERKRDSYKGDFGKLLNIAGCSRMSGAAQLSTLSALRSGAGLVTLASVKDVIDRTGPNMPEALLLELPAGKDGAVSRESADIITGALEKMTAVSAGCGLSVSAGTVRLIEAVIKNADCPIILDADGINAISDNIDIIKNVRHKLILTPHIGELARLAGKTPAETAEDRFNTAAELSEKYNAVVVAKGTPTFITGDKKAYVCGLGNPGLSKGGSGDVLTGIISSLAAQGVKPFRAAAAGVYIHGLAADMTAEKSSMAGMLPSDVINELPLAFKKIMP